MDVVWGVGCDEARGGGSRVWARVRSPLVLSHWPLARSIDLEILSSTLRKLTLVLSKPN